MGVVSVTWDFIKGAFTAGALREKLLTAEILIKTVKEENINLKEQKAALVKQVEELEEELGSFRRAEKELVEHRGFFYKRRPGGGYFEAVFCPRCKGRMVLFFPDRHYSCPTCQFEPLDIGEGGLTARLKELKGL